MTKALLIGEARGAQELRFNHGFVGPSGRELARMCAAAGMLDSPPRYPDENAMIQYWAEAKSHGIEIANVFEEHPPNNEIGEFFAKDGDHSFPKFKSGNKVGYVLPQYTHHIHKLRDRIFQSKPTVIVALGNTACWAILGTTSIGAIRGTVHWSEGFNLKVIPAYHPAAVLRQWSLRPATIADLTKANRHTEFPEIRRTERWITIVDPTHQGLMNAAAWFNRRSAKYAIDIETAFGQISMVGFARSSHDALVIPLHNPNGSSYWPNVDMEVRAWKLIQRGLKSDVPKIFQNGIFDLGYFMRMGLQVRYPIGSGDTMLRHHAAFPELPKGLGFLGSLYCDEQAWKQMRTNNRDTISKRDE